MTSHFGRIPPLLGSENPHFVGDGLNVVAESAVSNAELSECFALSEFSLPKRTLETVFRPFPFFRKEPEGKNPEGKNF